MDARKFNKNEYFKLGRWIAPILEYETWMDWCDTPESRELGVTPDAISGIALDGNYMFPNNGAYPFIRDLVAKEFKEGKSDTAKKILHYGEVLANECLKLSHSLGVDATVSELMDSLEAIKRIRFPWMACFAVSDAADIYLKNYADKSGISVDVLNSKIPQLANMLTEDQKKLFIFKQEIEKNKLPLNLAVIKEKNIELAGAMEKYQKETEYIGTHHFWGEARTMNKFIEAIGHSNVVEAKKTNVPDEIKDFFDIVAETTKQRLGCAQSSAHLVYSFRTALTNFAKKFDLEYDDIVFLTTEEIKSLDRGINDGINIKIKERQKGFGMYKENGVIHISVGDELREQLKDLGLIVLGSEVKEFKGNIGCKGLVTGIVAVVLVPADNVKVKKGMVLVAPETTPDFIPAMARAAAFVTDRGGVTSHAAIVAREMGKPCIIGTQIATQVLKDGDLVEVDAVKGIVKKIQ